MREREERLEHLIEAMQQAGERLTRENDRLKAENQSLKEFAKWYTAGVPESVTEPLPLEPLEIPMRSSFYYSGPSLWLLPYEDQKEALKKVTVHFGGKEYPLEAYADLPL